MSDAITPRRRLAEELLDLVALIADELAAIEAKKEQLRGEGEAGGFTETVPGKGAVTVTKPRKGGFIGTLPTLDPELFMAMNEEERTSLLANGVVQLVAKYSKPAIASVSVKPSAPARV